MNTHKLNKKLINIMINQIETKLKNIDLLLGAEQGNVEFTDKTKDLVKKNQYEVIEFLSKINDLIRRLANTG